MTTKVNAPVQDLPLLTDDEGNAVYFDKDRHFDDFQQHPWAQIGYELHCNPCPRGRFKSHMARLKPGFMLVGSLGNWSIVREGGQVRVKP